MIVRSSFHSTSSAEFATPGIKHGDLRITGAHYFEEAIREISQWVYRCQVSNSQLGLFYRSNSAGISLLPSIKVKIREGINKKLVYIEFFLVLIV